ncbi:hypothetical protein GT347_20330 [Xylophilus rhododendri]|uniref:Uncharacterized protein n=1 Tax=Xylophilus rhododendri TaxID=2697032 RepID=A0A857JAQ0_9BURK|nr:hypothetical protein [Xylophilus rhododendri]QHJ00120.1 hypothetical protein GT347_20330 [Xylophilus rhododendri]
MEPESRLSRILAKGDQPELPPDPLPELTAILMDAGPTQPSGMGPVPLTATELRAWQQGTATYLTRWEFRLVLRLSAEYLAELQRASDPLRPPPWINKPTPERRVSVAKHIRNLLRD